MPPVFLCDAMLGGLARWLRAAGYRAEFDVHIRDGELVRRGYQEDKTLITSDTDLLERYAVRESLVRTIYLPPGMSPLEQLSRVMNELDLDLRQPRCMECGAGLEEKALAEVEDEVPPGVKQNCDVFFRCRGCGKLYWRGSHWQDIRRKLQWAAEPRE